MPDPHSQMPAANRRGFRWLVRRVEKKGLRPRFAAYLVIVSWSIAIVVFGVVERLVDPDTFGSIWLGVWWATQTVTTVGYGDIVPESTSGKAIAIVLMLGGLSFLAVLTGAITSAFVARAQKDLQQSGEDPVLRRLDELEAQLKAIQSEVAGLPREP